MTNGRIKAISVSTEKGTQKTNVPEAELRIDLGIVGDAHAGKWHRQVSLLAVESIDKMVAMGANVSPGNFAENITTEGIDLLKLSLGGRLRLGRDVELEVTQFGKKCHSRCEIFEQVGDCIMPREGIFAKVISPGRINVGDVIEVLDD
ncbi:MAG: MOSC domain-containing protein [Planctomycetes bacterium B3_Pla]|nr:MAG: MOSC domain-containing protein [Planctomycetes bacterium B3_Pla]